MTMTKLYISGPMRHVPEFNFPAFNKAAQFLRERGYFVFNPAEMDRFFCPEVDSTTLPTDSYIRRDVHVIINELFLPYDGMVMLPGWQQSRGATAEHALAIWRGLNIWTLEDFGGFSWEALEAGVSPAENRMVQEDTARRLGNLLRGWNAIPPPLLSKMLYGKSENGKRSTGETSKGKRG